MSGIEYDSFLDAMKGDELYLADIPPMIWAVENVIPAGVTVLLAPPKSAKTWFACKLALHAAAGTPFLGVPVKPRPVLNVSLESSKGSIHRRYATLMGNDIPFPRSLQTRLVVDPDKVEEQLQEWLDANGEEDPMIFIDTLGCVKTWGNSTAKDYKFGMRMRRLLSPYPGASMIILHHPTKTGEKAARKGDIIGACAGSTGLPGSVDTILYLDSQLPENIVRGQSYPGTLSRVSREAPNMKIALLFTDGSWDLDGADLDDAIANVGRDTATEIPEASRLGTDSQAVLDFVNAEGQTTPKDVAEHFTWTNTKASTYLQRLVKGHHIGTKGHGVYIAL